MALSVVLPHLLEVIFDKLSSSILEQFSLTFGVKEEIKKLSRTLSTIRAVLEDAEKMQISEAAIIDWLRKLKDAAYEANDIIDECEALIVPDSGDNIQVCNSFLTCIELKHLKLRHSIAKRIRKITAKFDSIAIERNNFHFRERVPERAAEEFMRQRETGSAVCEPVVYGRDDDKEKLIDILLSNANSECNLQVYPIVGIGGLGKTTLAQVIYNEERIAETFNTRIWVCVSEDFSVKRLIKMIIASLSGAECELEGLDPLQKRLKELLSGKKFLLVLDDVWSENQDLWENFKCSLNCGANGSSIIITTRLSTVAEIMGTSSRYELKPLSYEYCWALFKARAFGMESENESLEAIGKQIVEKCRGVPLVAKALGGTLRFERDEIMWNSVRDSDIWELEEDRDNILPSLRLSYNHLPSYLRQCFVYCSIYPKDHDIEIEELVQLWMANEFLQSDGRMELEDVGNHIFDQLVLRSFLQDVEKDNKGKPIRCKMHDLMHDLACSVARAECYSFVGGNNIYIIPKTVRHLLIYRAQCPRNFVQHLGKSHPLLHTCLFDRLPSDPQIEFVFKNLISLRVFRATYVSNLPRSIGKLKHLRYLDLTWYPSNELPKSICSLRNLQTLKLCQNYNLQKLPESIHKLINLRHLDLSYCRRFESLDGIEKLINLRHVILSYCSSLSQLPDGIEKLVNLRHLDSHGCDSLTQLPDGIGELINLRYLDLSGYRSLTQLPDGIGELINLRRLVLPGNLPIWSVRVGKLSLLEDLGNFVVGTEESGHSIKELHHLNHLQGLLRIDGVENVRDGEEGKQANLTAKKNLSSLELQWDIYGRRNISGNSEEDVLQALQPPLNLSGRLFITGYRGSKFPSWTNNLVNLAEIGLYDCPKCEDLPPLGHLPLLKKLKIKRIYSLKRINKQFYGINSSQAFFPSLEYLQFSVMPKWEEWEDLDHKQVFPCLRELVLWICPNLILLPSAILYSAQNFEVHDCEKMRSLPLMPCHRVLKVGGSSSFHTALKSLSQQHQSSLQTLRISNCPQLELSVGDFQHLIAIKELDLDGLPKLTSLPDLHHLSTLQILRIRRCNNLTVLPHGMQNLTSLHTLNILYCHADLHLRCQTDQGEYWPYISHIPNLDIY
ncbi:hypothetical protein ACHQM5_011829 [Ranunculus cassubicifolius]